MAISSTLVGKLGGVETINSRFWFSNTNRELASLNKTWNVSQGDWLLAWNGIGNNYDSGRNSILVNGTARVTDLGFTAGEPLGGYFIVTNTTKISLTGTGLGRFQVDPDVILVKLA